MRIRRRSTRWAPVAVLAVLMALLVPGGRAQAAGLYTVTPVAGNLKAYHVSGVYVAGVSSGGYMAGQL
jgi:hypothetical protein